MDQPPTPGEVSSKNETEVSLNDLAPERGEQQPEGNDPEDPPQLERQITNPFRRRMQIARAEAAAQAAQAAQSTQSASLAASIDTPSNETAVQPPPKAVFKDLRSAHTSITSCNGRTRAETVVNRPELAVQQGASGESSGESSIAHSDIGQPLPLPVPEPTFEEIDLGPRVDMPNTRERHQVENGDIEGQTSLQRRLSMLDSVTSYVRNVFAPVRSATTGHASDQDTLNEYRSAYPSTSSNGLGNNSRQEHGTNHLALDDSFLPEMQFSSSPAITHPRRHGGLSMQFSSSPAITYPRNHGRPNMQFSSPPAITYAERYDGQSMQFSSSPAITHPGRHGGPSMQFSSTPAITRPERYDGPRMQFSSSPTITHPGRQGGHNVASSSTYMSQPEGSTIGEIYRQYEGTGTSPAARNSTVGFTYGNGAPMVDPESLRPPNYLSLPSDIEHDARQSEQSSYGDSQALLDASGTGNLTENSNDPQSALPTFNVEHVHSDNALSVAQSTVPSLTDVNWRNRYSVTPDSRLGRAESLRSQNNRATTEAPPRAVSPTPTEVESDRLPLEREISQELRRVSGISQTSLDDSAYRGYEARYNPGTDAHGNFVPREPVDGSNTDGVSELSDDSESTIDAPYPQTNHPPPPAPDAFYHAPAIPPQWISPSHNIRIPIVRPEIPPRSPRRPGVPFSSVPPVAPAPRQSQNEDDWVTEDGSIWENDSVGINHRVRRIESTITDTSAASASIMSEDRYGSAERITQHPAPMGGTSNYRRRDLTNGNRPILLPTPDQYRVNGFPSNSLRFKPPNAVYQTPAPLRRRHEHPFGSSPPEVLSPTRGGRQTQFPLTTSTLTSDDSGTTSRRPDSRVKRNDSDRNNRLSHTRDWRRRPVSANSTTPRRIAESTGTVRPERPTSYGLMAAFAAGESVPGYNIVNGRVVPDYEQLDGIYGPEPVLHHESQNRRTIRPRVGDVPVGGFDYRGPSAAPKYNRGRDLYTPSQLIELDDMAPRGPHQNRMVSTVSEGPSQRHLSEAPILNTFVDEEMPARVVRDWNIMCLVICAVFPPVLLLFASGLLDFCVDWYTKGSLPKFSSFYKKIALATKSDSTEVETSLTICLQGKVFEGTFLRGFVTEAISTSGI
ncbi:uncharacterized protein LY89DRAFT_13428 [Mollisia scopiformis]|uniref:Uncharacterized protein n=1 Tax=Mollisia scopiformis TaxID=149040 RepID=A0A194XVI0_MOLSC|nr:uncharacterized protein LY89DRAFT_13428 [Mollisia scopiformis]KUJ24141.1 hypothetical protein LY89DRAFT_13428 [Mollisia scopiformis]